MLISVITATFNSQASIRNTIDSIRKQDYPVEHVVVDGASSDGTVAILKEFSHLVWISEPDKGVYDAFNKGIKMAKGDWIYFLGSDDELLPGTLKKLAGHLTDPSLDIVYGNVWVKKTQRSYNGQFTLADFLTNNVCQQAIFYKKEFFQNNLFNLDYPIYADYAFNINLLAKKDLKVKYLPLDIALYDGDGMSERIVDPAFLKNKISLFCQALKKSRWDPLFDHYRHQEAINQILYGSLILGWVEMGVFSFRRNNTFKNIYTALAMTKCRLSHRGDKGRPTLLKN